MLDNYLLSTLYSSKSTTGTVLDPPATASQPAAAEVAELFRRQALSLERRPGTHALPMGGVRKEGMMGHPNEEGPTGTVLRIWEV